MKVALFIPCYVDQFYPNVGDATLELLEKLGVEVDFPLNQTCCGQPMANSGCEQDGTGAAHLFVKNFKDYDYIVGPTGSCVLHVREHFNKIPQTDDVKKVNRVKMSTNIQIYYRYIQFGFILRERCNMITL